MSGGENARGRLDAQEDTKQVLDQWVESLAKVLESMTDQHPQTGWQPASGTFSDVAGSDSGPVSEILWWEQPFQLPGAAAWVGTPRVLWEYAGTLTLKAAGIETVELSEARNTWFEVLSQSLSAMARSIGSLVGREVNCEGGTERPPADTVLEWARVSLGFAEGPPAPLLVAFNTALIEQLKPSELPSAAETNAAAPPLAEVRVLPAKSRTLDLILDVDLPVSISFGKAELPMRDVLKLTTGSIVELNRGITDPVEVLVNHCLIARGEVVVVDGNYGVRIQEIVSRQDRLRSIR
jgi:flagellar motor switch protein FliN